jgi:chromosome segregation ATPase
MKSVKEQREELERENKKIVTKINDTKKKISHLEVQIEELKITIKHIGVTGK